MLFTSYPFLVFLPLVAGFYWLMRRWYKGQNLLLFVASYTFYGWWDWRFLFLIFGSSLLDFWLARAMGQSESPQKRRLLLYLSLALNLGVLGYFKYANFFLENLARLLSAWGLPPVLEDGPLSIILPLGISFYTFQTLGYTIDVYRYKLKPSRNFLEYITFVSFFPQLVAGPIERAGNLLPQFLAKRSWQKAHLTEGLRQMLWGFFKKLAIADTLAPQVNYVFAHHEELNGLSLALGALLFTFQMYCDFSGYSDIAIGAARLFGFRLMKNFDFPFYSSSMSEFWRRWHISLSTWIQDYLYNPLAINRRYWGIWGVAFALLVAFTLSGLWHGAAWTFVLWGGLHGMVLAYEALSKKKRKRWSRQLGGTYLWVSRILVFCFWVFTLTIFRAQDLPEAWSVLGGSLSRSWWGGAALPLSTLLLPLALLVFEYFQRHRAHGLDLKGYPYPLRWSLYALLLILIFESDNLNRQTEFIYFQF